MKEKRYRIEEIPEDVRGELCAKCGKCCKTMIFDGLQIDRRSPWDRSYINWVGMHGGDHKIIRKGDGVSMTVVIPAPCSKLVGNHGSYRCGIYKKRPLMCEEYDCLDDDDIGDTGWKKYIREKRARQKRRTSNRRKGAGLRPAQAR